MMANLQERQEVATELRGTIETFLNSPKIKDLNKKQLENIAKSVLVDQLKDSFKKEVKKSKFDVAKLKTKWLNTFDSKATKESFEYNLDVFLTWLGSKSILDVDAQIVDDYILYLKNSKTIIKGKKNKKGKSKNISDNSVRQRVATCSSFFKSLHRWKVVNQNPFLGCKLPKKPLLKKSSSQVPSDTQLDEIEQYCVDRMNLTSGKNYSGIKGAAQNALIAIKVLRESGMRSDALPNLVLDKDGSYKSFSKGSVIYGRLSNELIEQLKSLGKQPFKNYKYFKKWWQRTVKKLGYKFTGVHSIRNRFAINHYQEHKDVVALMKLLQHKNINSVHHYLSSLGMDVK